LKGLDVALLKSALKSVLLAEAQRTQSERGFLSCISAFVMAFFE